METKKSQPGQAFLRFISSIVVNRAQTMHSARDRMLANSHAGRGTRLPPTWKLARPLNTSAFVVTYPAHRLVPGKSGGIAAVKTLAGARTVLFLHLGSAVEKDGERRGIGFIHFCDDEESLPVAAHI